METKYKARQAHHIFKIMTLLLTRRKKSKNNKSFKRQNKFQVTPVIKVQAQRLEVPQKLLENYAVSQGLLKDNM